MLLTILRHIPYVTSRSGNDGSPTLFEPVSGVPLLSVPNVYSHKSVDCAPLVNFHPNCLATVYNNSFGIPCLGCSSLELIKVIAFIYVYNIS